MRFLAPWILSLTLLLVFPLLVAAGLSLCFWDFLSPPRFAGLQNYSALMADPQFWNALKVTFTLALLQVPLEVLGGLGLALLMAKPQRGASLFRTLCFLPSVISGVASALIGVWLFHPEGLVNWMLGLIGVQGPRWFLDPNFALIALWLLGVWGLGRTAVIFLAALNDLPKSVYEAASLDGASDFVAFRSMTLPMLSPTFAFVATTSLAATLQTFVGAYVATAGGPLDSTTTVVMYLYVNGFQQQRVGYAAAIAMVAFAISFAAAWLAASRWEES
jgi:multiple sugar transport system permease protein